MAHGRYEVLALLPESSDFTLQRAVAYFASLTFSRVRSGKFIYKNAPVRAELATVEGEQTPSGFRVFYGDWLIVAWLEADDTVRIESREMAEGDDLPAAAEVIARCSRRLSVWSDEDPEFEFTDDFTRFIDHLRERFGTFIKDYVNGCWWS
jgi:hypothetical protein